MAPLDTRPLPEELLLLCAEPVRGRLRIPQSAFYWAVPGSVLAELQLGGAITVDGRRITGFQPLGSHDEIAAGVLARLEETGKRKHRLGLDLAMRRIPRKPTQQLFLDRLTAEGVLTVDRRSFLGLPYRRYTAVPPGIGQEIAARVAATLAADDAGPAPTASPVAAAASSAPSADVAAAPADAPPAAGGEASDAAGTSTDAADGDRQPADQDGRSAAQDRQTADRDRQLAGLIYAAGLHRRLYPGPAGAPTRRAARRLANELPVPRAVRRAISAMSASTAS
ncbi:GPP34 family phosphoprotein [Kitasatospora sp. CM 4170]|uniref:GPP34 family phosphoprotein n=1 Tax=Kitasatospora aburaviensis TaxID=67265 RepID=A0ABW1ESM7_9ACTN|nr:GPP34 family phosphoprotein [Kitasatospora sp. CM 4170]WNM45910.1 GPP34 family phosphoprotein [Kitasatospora sp. CM 4170]